MKDFHLLLSLTIAVAGMSGCGSADAETVTGSVRGTVVIGGKPLTQGSLQLYNTLTGNGASFLVDASGTFSSHMPVVADEYTVYVGPGSSPPESGGGPPTMPKMPANVPRKYQSFSTSDKKVTISEGENEIKIEF